MNRAISAAVTSITGLGANGSRESRFNRGGASSPMLQIPGPVSNAGSLPSRTSRIARRSSVAAIASRRMRCGPQAEASDQHCHKTRACDFGLVPVGDLNQLSRPVRRESNTARHQATELLHASIIGVVLERRERRLCEIRQQAEGRHWRLQCASGENLTLGTRFRRRLATHLRHLTVDRAVPNPDIQRSRPAAITDVAVPHIARA
jgi:hypothetical protein